MNSDTWFDNYVPKFIFNDNNLTWKIDSKYDPLIAEYRKEVDFDFDIFIYTMLTWLNNKMPQFSQQHVLNMIFDYLDQAEPAEDTQIAIYGFLNYLTVNLQTDVIDQLDHKLFKYPKKATLVEYESIADVYCNIVENAIASSLGGDEELAIKYWQRFFSLRENRLQLNIEFINNKHDS